MLDKTGLGFQIVGMERAAEQIVVRICKQSYIVTLGDIRLMLKSGSEFVVLDACNRSVGVVGIFIFRVGSRVCIVVSRAA